MSLSSALLPVEEAASVLGALFAQPSLLKRLFGIFSLSAGSADGQGPDARRSGFVPVLDAHDSKRLEAVKSTLPRGSAFEGMFQTIAIVPPVVYTLYEKSGCCATEMLTKAMVRSLLADQRTGDGETKLRKRLIAKALQSVVYAPVWFCAQTLLPIPYGMVKVKDDDLRRRVLGDAFDEDEEWKGYSKGDFHVVNLSFSDEEVYIALCLYLPATFVGSQDAVRKAFSFLECLKRTAGDDALGGMPLQPRRSLPGRRGADEEHVRMRNGSPIGTLLRAALIYLVARHRHRQDAENRARDFLVRAELTRGSTSWEDVHTYELYAYRPSEPGATQLFGEIRLLVHRETQESALLVGSFDAVDAMQAREMVRGEMDIKAYIQRISEELLQGRSTAAIHVHSCELGKITSTRYPNVNGNVDDNVRAVRDRVQRCQAPRAPRDGEGDLDQYKSWLLVEGLLREDLLREGLVRDFGRNWLQEDGYMRHRFCKLGHAEATHQGSNGDSGDLEDLKDLEDLEDTSTIERPLKRVKTESNDTRMYEILQNGNTVVFFDKRHQGHVFYHGVSVHYDRKLPLGVSFTTLVFQDPLRGRSRRSEDRWQMLKHPSLTEAMKGLLSELCKRKDPPDRFIQHLEKHFLEHEPGRSEPGSFGYGFASCLQPFLSFVDAFMTARIGQVFREHSVQERLSRLLSRYASERRRIPVLTSEEAKICGLLTDVEEMKHEPWYVGPYLYTLAENAKITLRWRAIDFLMSSAIANRGRSSLCGLERSICRILTDLRIVKEDHDIVLHNFAAPFFYALRGGREHHINVNPQFDFWDVITGVLISQPLAKFVSIQQLAHESSFFRNQLVWDCRGDLEGCNILLGEMRRCPSEQDGVTLRGHRDRPTALEFNQGGTLLASVGLDRLLCLWDAQDGRLLARHRHKTRLWSLAWARGGSHALAGHEMLAVGDSDGCAHVYHVSCSPPGPERCCTLESPDGPILAVCFRDGPGTALACSSATGTIRIWLQQAPSVAGKLAFRCGLVLLGHTGPVWDLLWIPAPSPLAGVSLDGEAHMLVSGGGDGTVRSWRVSPDLQSHAECEGGPQPFSHHGLRLSSHCSAVTCSWKAAGRIVRVVLSGSISEGGAWRLYAVEQKSGAGTTQDVIHALDLTQAGNLTVGRGTRKNLRIFDCDAVGEDCLLWTQTNRQGKSELVGDTGPARLGISSETRCVVRCHRRTGIVAVGLNAEYEGVLGRNPLSTLESVLIAEMGGTRADVNPRGAADTAEVEEGEVAVAVDGLDEDHAWDEDHVWDEGGGGSHPKTHVDAEGLDDDAEHNVIGAAPACPDFKDLSTLFGVDTTVADHTPSTFPWEESTLTEPGDYPLGQYLQEYQPIIEAERAKPARQNLWDLQSESVAHTAASEWGPAHGEAKASSTAEKNIKPEWP